MRRTHEIVPQESVQAPEIRFKRVKERERFGGIHMVEIPAEREGMPARHFSDGVHELRAAFFIEVRVATVHAHGEHVRHLQMRLRAHGGKVEKSVCVLNAQLVDQRSRDHGSQIADQRLIAERVVLKSRGQVKAVIQRGKVGRTLIVEEITHEHRFFLAEVMVQFGKQVVVVDRTVDK